MNTNKFFVWCAVKRHLSQGSMRTTKTRWNYLEHWLGRRKLTSKIAEQFVLYIREKGLRNASINSYIRIFKLIDVFERENGRNLNLLKHIEYFDKQRKIPTILSFEEIEAIINTEIPFTWYATGGRISSGKYSSGRLEERHKFINRTYRLAIWFLAATGCRIDEMASLTKENLSLGINDNWVTFKDTKTMDDRDVLLPPRLGEELKEHTKDKKPDELVFVSSLGNKLVEQTFNVFLRKKVELAGVQKHVYAHCFRNSFIMEHIRRGTGHLTISKLVGHRDPKTTIGYTRYDRSDLIRGAENHPFFIRYLTKERILEKAGEYVQKCPGMDDPRFTSRIEKMANKILVEIVLTKE